ncbi:UNVERIFIED_CONTAM: hypothetical protein Sangu_1115600 [Sesamum angustifolium]|uniref:Uncharacterized protein n=1 Tax=Sesamum angustifolium TaxID=2727405 RepID=A0AAW2P1B1_9LAMI
MGSNPVSINNGYDQTQRQTLFTSSLGPFSSSPSFPLLHKPQRQEEEEESPEEGLFKCFLSCEKRRQNEHELSQCEERCVREYQERKREEREERGGRGGDEETVVPKIEEPRKVYEQCLSKCGKTEGSRQQYGQCRRICERRYEQQQQQQQREKRGGGEGTVKNHHRRDPEQQYKQCQSRCGREERGEQRQYCQQKCQWEYERQKENTSASTAAEEVRRIPEKKGKKKRNRKARIHTFSSHRGLIPSTELKRATSKSSRGFPRSLSSSRASTIIG